ncbi:50S ribosomal protein L24 [Thiomicrospira cyclica]|jgi:large subunit ribosomal protein L24|uniref:Large ribosomal subunit protein uL24 n=1 Tax=Thiomicrospira cyclica (strain DSM 14477 / JCM 11371 / ALM1) TaxID=717773 RepID=F6D9F2_THICA|nr:50S ribosomal protein L24 [Thiomicrospira cyclica]AEG30909.1 ribosomal protein L24 [Thiomicrospira cyclica ALM1]
MNRLKKGDEVVVITGKDKGKKGTVSRIVSAEKVLVDGINLVKKHTKANPMTGAQGGIVTKEMPIHVSNVALVNPETQKADRVGFRVENDVKIRYFKSTNKAVDA